MKIEPGCTVRVHYALYDTTPEGDLLEKTEEDDPFTFIYGEDEVLPLFEQNLLGLKVGDTFGFGIDSDDAYGPEDESAVVELPKSNFLIDGEIDEDALAEGEMVEMEDEEGNEVYALVIENKLNEVVLDFNHPMAGLNLWFVGKVIAVE